MPLVSRSSQDLQASANTKTGDKLQEFALLSPTPTEKANPMDAAV